MALKYTVKTCTEDKIYNSDKDTTNRVVTAQYLKYTLNSGIKQLSVHVVLQREELPLELEIAGQRGHGDGLAGVAVPLDKVVECWRSGGDIA